MNACREKRIRSIGTYFLVMGFICACLVPMYFSVFRLVVPICVVLMCAPRLMYNYKKWASVLLMTGAILTTLALLFFDWMSILFSLSNAFGSMDVSGAIFMSVITVIALLSCYLCYRLFKLLFGTRQS